MVMVRSVVLYINILIIVMYSAIFVQMVADKDFTDDFAIQTIH